MDRNHLGGRGRLTLPQGGIHEGLPAIGDDKLVVAMGGPAASALLGAGWLFRNDDADRGADLFEQIAQMQAGKSTPPLLLNDHCQAWEFCQECRTQAIKDDSLSLLRGLGEKEVKTYGRKGLFTLTQLAHTFRPRRNSNRSDCGSTRRYHALQAMAIRDKTVYVLGALKVPFSAVRIYVDVEGDPDEAFVYLIGMIVCDGNSENRFSFWANDKNQELSIFEQFLGIVAKYEAPSIFCYGSYERAFFKRMRQHARRKTPVDKVLGALTNTLSIIYAHCYFPTYSNGLKEVAGCLAAIMHHAGRFLHGWPTAARQQSVRPDRCRSLALRHV